MGKRKKLSTIDCETDPFKHGRFPKPFIWGFYNDDTWESFRNTDDFVAFLKEQYVFAYAHNGGKFDFTFLLPYIEDKTDVLIINGRIARMVFGKATLIDSYCLLPLPLSAMQKDSFDYDLMEENVRELHIDEIEKYLYGDCKYLHDYLINFIESYGRSLTIAGAAMKIYRKMGGYVPIWPDVYKAIEYYNTFKPFYHGGRVEAIEQGIFKNDFTIVDINSAYPDAMRNKPHPFVNKYIKTNSPRDSEIELSLLDIDCVSYGALPLSDKSGISFPRDNIVRNFLITGHEFITALETKSIRKVKINSAYVFERSELNYFEAYIDRFYELKRKAKIEKNNFDYTYAKLFQNSLYGKFGTNPSTYTESIIDSWDNPPGNEYYSESLLPDGDMCIWSRPIQLERATFYNVATAASITGAVRAKLLRSLCTVDSPVYCDTDSIICKSVNGLPISDKLGDWSIEGKPDKVAIAGKKMYVCYKGGKPIKQANKGVKISAKDIENVAKGKTIVYDSIAPTFSIKTGKRFISRRVKRTGMEI